MNLRVSHDDVLVIRPHARASRLPPRSDVIEAALGLFKERALERASEKPLTEEELT